MSLVLDVTGKMRDDGTPISVPRLTWTPAYSGAIPNPGTATHYYADRKSNVLRLAQRPRAKFSAPFIPSTTYELNGPLERAGRPGLVLEEANAAGNEVDDWDFTSGSWIADSCSASAEEVGPTGVNSGDGEAHLLTPSANGGSMRQAFSTPTDTNADTYVFSVWIKKEGGGPCSLRILSGATSNYAHFTLTTSEWTRIQVSSPNAASTAPTCYVYPGGALTHDSEDQSVAVFWGPVLENRNTSAGVAGLPAGSTMLHTASSRTAVRWDTEFAWPVAPWTMLCEYTPLWVDENGVAYEIFRAADLDLNAVIRFHKNASGLTLLDVLDRGGSTVSLGDTLSHSAREFKQVIATAETDGSLTMYVDGGGTDFKAARIAAPPSSMSLNHVTTGADVILHRLAVWDRLIDASRLF